MLEYTVLGAVLVIRKTELIQQQNEFKVNLAALEALLLEKLANAEGDILDDTELILSLEDGALRKTGTHSPSVSFDTTSYSLSPSQSAAQEVPLPCTFEFHKLMPQCRCV